MEIWSEGGWNKILRTARNRRILHMAMEWIYIYIIYIILLVLISVTDWVDPWAIVRPEGLSMKNSNNNIGNRFRDLPLRGAVPQPLHHRVPRWTEYIYNFMSSLYFKHNSMSFAKFHRLALWRVLTILTTFHTQDSLHAVSHIPSPANKAQGKKTKFSTNVCPKWVSNPWYQCPGRRRGWQPQPVRIFTAQIDVDARVSVRQFKLHPCKLTTSQLALDCCHVSTLL
jgi:hypothetical protein